MIVEFGSDADPKVSEAGRFDRLSITGLGPLAGARMGTLARVDAGETHVWLFIAAVRAELARVEAGNQALAPYEAMIPMPRAMAG